jgi:hypothetical protein
MCQGFTDTILECHVDTFIRIVKGKSFRLKGRYGQNSIDEK